MHRADPRFCQGEGAREWPRFAPGFYIRVQPLRKEEACAVASERVTAAVGDRQVLVCGDFCKLGLNPFSPHHIFPSFLAK